MIFPRAAQTSAAVAGHYDELDGFYREIWGEHVHHGYWATGRETPAQAADALVWLLAERLHLSPRQKICDIGCGYGATAQMLAERHGVAVTGVTISAAQATIAALRAPSRGALDIRCKDWLQNDFPNASFDRAYAVESSEHMTNKQRCFAEAFRTLRPGGLLVVCAWLARTDPRPWEVRHLLEPICREGRLPAMGDLPDYEALLRQAGFELLHVDDISRAVAPTWAVCLRRIAGKMLTDRRYLRYLMNKNAGNRVFLLTILRLLVAFRMGAMRYCVLTARKPVTATT
jgi:tocopherol O-methyltransferase